MDQIGDGIRKILKAGIGAVETVVEKSGEVIDQLADRGTETYNQVVQKGGEIVDKIRKSFAGTDINEILSNPEALADIEEALVGLPMETLQKLRAMLDRAEEAAKQAAQACCCDDTDCCCDEKDCGNGDCCCEPACPCGCEDAKKDGDEGNG